MSEEYVYTAPSGITVTSCYPDPGDDFKSVYHYLYWSYSSWGKKIWAGIKYNMEHGWKFEDDGISWSPKNPVHSPRSQRVVRTSRAFRRR